MVKIKTTKTYFWEGQFVCFHFEDCRWYNNVLRSNFFAIDIAPSGHSFGIHGRSEKTENHKHSGGFHFVVI